MIPLIAFGLIVVGCTFAICYTLEKLCKRLDRLAAAWEKDDDDDDPSNAWRKENV